MNKTLARIFRLEPGAATIAQYQPPSPEVMEKVLLTGDLAALNPGQRLSYYESVCRALKLNPLTKPFEYITLNGKLTLYTRKDCTDQLRKIYGISIRIISRDISSGVIVVCAQASLPNGRNDESIGSVSSVYPDKTKSYGGSWIDHPKAGQELSGDDRANAMMKSETKAKRRVTLSICGLGMFDESEMESIQEPNDAESKVRQATANRVAIEQGEHEVTGTITEENFMDVTCHIGKAEGDMLGKKISEIHPKVLSWLKNHFGDGEGIRWGNPPNEKDQRLYDAVTLALAKL